MTKSHYQAICLVLFGLVMAGLHWMISGLGIDFGYGFLAGMTMTMGCLAIIFRSVREL
jgi:hypothetical protein